MTPQQFKQWRRDWQQRHADALIMGILNVTPDSFSDGGQHLTTERARFRIQQLLDEGADIIDVGGESSRPGAQPVSLEEELSRVLPVIEAIRQQSSCMISIDTCKSAVMAAAIAVGATMINDITALSKPDALAVAANLNVPICLMHMQGNPSNMQKNPNYPEGILASLLNYFKERLDMCLSAGIAVENVIIDPGFGFGKTLGHNLTMLRELSQLSRLNIPILVGVSRKSFLGAITGEPESNRTAAGLVVAVHALNQGAALIRTHDVASTKQALLMMNAIKYSERFKTERT